MVLKAMDTLDFWMGQVAIYVFAMIQVIVFGWHFGAKRGLKLANEGSVIKLPKLYAFVVKYLTPAVLLAVFTMWIAKDVFGVIGSGKLSPYITDIVGESPNMPACIAVVIACGLYAFFALILMQSKKYDRLGKEKK